MTKKIMSPITTFILEASKFSQDNLQTTLVCANCTEVFQKEFPIELEGVTAEFKCPVCNSVGEADLPYKVADEPEKLQADLLDSQDEEEEEEA